ncbi:hypothetical protein WJX79_010139 [Trebouxia sp. C0005]
MGGGPADEETGLTGGVAVGVQDTGTGAKDESSWPIEAQICMMLLVVFLSADGSQSCCGCDVAVRLNFGPTHSLTHSAQSCCCYFSKGGNEPWPWVMHYGSSATVISDEDEPVE